MLTKWPRERPKTKTPARTAGATTRPGKPSSLRIRWTGANVIKTHPKGGPHQRSYPGGPAYAARAARVGFDPDWWRHWLVLLAVGAAAAFLAAPLVSMLTTAASFWWGVGKVAAPLMLTSLPFISEILNSLARLAEVWNRHTQRKHEALLCSTGE